VSVSVSVSELITHKSRYFVLHNNNSGKTQNQGSLCVCVCVSRPIEGRSGTAIYSHEVELGRVLMDSVARMLGASQDQVKVRDIGHVSCVLT